MRKKKCVCLYIYTVYIKSIKTFEKKKIDKSIKNDLNTLKPPANVTRFRDGQKDLINAKIRVGVQSAQA